MTCKCADDAWVYVEAGTIIEALSTGSRFTTPERGWVRFEDRGENPVPWHMWVGDDVLFCDRCGTRLNPDGTTTERCDAVTAEAENVLAPVDGEVSPNLPCPVNIIEDYECNSDSDTPCDDPRCAFACWRSLLWSVLWANSQGPLTPIEFADNPNMTGLFTPECEAWHRGITQKVAEKIAALSGGQDTRRLDALARSRISMTDGGELYWLHGEAGTAAGAAYDVARIRDLADAIIAAQPGEERDEDD